jgi:small-conductance mechanosensitive channel
VSVWTDDPWNERRLLSDLNDRIWWALKAADVVIAFPQQDVHLDPAVVDALTTLAARRQEGGDS